jgi:hypothetical protein
MAFWNVLTGDENRTALKRAEPVAAQVNALEEQFKALSDEQLMAKTAEFKKRLSEGESLDDLAPEAFAAVREASRRTLGQRHFDVQLIGGMVLHNGDIAEMRTGEGKTLVATSPPRRGVDGADLSRAGLKRRHNQSRSIIPLRPVARHAARSESGRRNRKFQSRERFFAPVHSSRCVCGRHHVRHQ